MASDECYAEMTWKGRPRTVIGEGGGADGTEGVLAVHSVSKRSNLAGLRFGWYAGDAEVVAFVRDVRQHAGFMVPGAVQLAGAAALADQEHADAQRARYQERLERLRQILAAVGVQAPFPEGGIYLWAPAPGGDALGPGRPAGGRSRAHRLAGGVLWRYRLRPHPRRGRSTDGAHRTDRVPGGSGVAQLALFSRWAPALPLAGGVDRRADGELASATCGPAKPDTRTLGATG